MPATESPASSFVGRTSALPFDVRPAPARPLQYRPFKHPGRGFPRPGPRRDPRPWMTLKPVRSGPPAAGILVTGSHRSGTTWVGKMLAEAGGLCYLHEPFKPKWDPPYVWTHFDTWFLHVAGHNAAEHERAVARTLGLRFSRRRHFGQDPSLRQVWASTDRWLRWAGRRARGRRPLVKDPIALFAAPWLADRFNLDVVAMIRHPAAFASSIKLKRWHFDFDHWRRQEELMSGLLAPFAGDIRRMAEHNDDLVEQAILQWRCFHHAILRVPPVPPALAVRPPRGPVAGPARRVPVDVPAAGAGVHAGLRAGGAGQQRRRQRARRRRGGQGGRVGPGGQRRQRAELAGRLTPDEVRRVREGTADVWPEFYAEEDWK